MKKTEKGKSPPVLAHTEAIKGINSMKVYHIKENLSMVLAVILCGDAYGCLYLFGEHLIYGTPITGWLLLPVVILAAFAVAALVCAAVRIVRYFRAPRRLGVVGAEVIRNCVEVRGCITK